jgi:hypothetical protein
MCKLWLRAMAVLVLVLVLAFGGSGGAGGDSAGIFGLVPDPAALSLIAFAGLGFFRRR